MRWQRGGVCLFDLLPNFPHWGWHLQIHAYLRSCPVMLRGTCLGKVWNTSSLQTATNLDINGQLPPVSSLFHTVNNTIHDSFRTSKLRRWLEKSIWSLASSFSRQWFCSLLAFDSTSLDTYAKENGTLMITYSRSLFFPCWLRRVE